MKKEITGARTFSSRSIQLCISQTSSLALLWTLHGCITDLKSILTSASDRGSNAKSRTKQYRTVSLILKC